MRTSTIKASIIAVFIVTLTASDASANKFKEWWHNIAVGHHRNNAWPEPFVEQDAMQVIAPFEIMKRNGWRMNNTIGHELFRDVDGTLSASGINTVDWIVTRAPAARRQIHVLSGSTPEETSQRVAAVQEALTKYGEMGASVNVYVTHTPTPTTNGAMATAINRKRLETIPAPKLPSSSAAGTAAATTQ